MAYSDYSTSLFGSKDMGFYSPPSNGNVYEFTARNRPESIVKNSDGQITGADIIMSFTAINPGGGSAANSRNFEYQARIVADSPCAIFAMPKIFGNARETGIDYVYKNYQGIINNFWEMESYTYYLITTTPNVNLYYDNTDGTQRVYVRQASNNITYIPPSIYGFLPDVRDVTTSYNLYKTSSESQVARIRTMNQLVSDLQTLNSDTQNGCRYHAGSQQFGRFKDEDLARLIALNTTWAAMPNSVYSNVRNARYTNIMDLLEGPYINPIGSTIASGFPIFTLDSYEQMIRYFQGEDYISDNDINPPPDDWSTDWDVYVRGANKPNIYVTMKSNKVDEWLASSDNESGISKGDITVEWRNRVFSEYPIESFTLSKWKTSAYNLQFDTSYMELVQLSYPESADAPGNDPVWMPEAPISELYPYYGQWEFRIKWNNYTSTWCYAKIGVIGSPSVTDFTLMKNVGGQTEYGFNDSSTVTIHYDIYPPGYDPYPTPDKPSTPGIIGGDTLPATPTDSALGLGLLTTTYLLTTAQCNELGAFLWNFDLFEKIKALNTNPLDNIVSIKIMPYAVSGSPREIVIGNVSTSINADKVGALPLYHVGSLEYAGRYDNFLDRGGDTSAHLFLPYIGFVPIDPIWFTDKKLDVYYAFDAVTGTCRAILAVDRIAVANYTSVCGIDIPLSMGSRAQQESAYVGASLGIMLAAAGAPVAGLAAGAGAVATIVQGDNKNQRTGGVSPMTAQYETRMCYIVIESVDANYARSMGHDKGFPCNATYALSQLRGFTQTVDTVDLSSIANATDQEKEEIKRLLVEGVYL